jgi:hypothetical protein
MKVSRLLSDCTNKTLDYTVKTPSLLPFKFLSTWHASYEMYTVTGHEGATNGGHRTDYGSSSLMTLRISY